MKALLISESCEMLGACSAFFEKNGYDTLCYRWLLKAMDNLEEIAPHVVFINGCDYPRHWKILVEHIRSGIYPSLPTVFLAAEHLSEDEVKKAEHLGVHIIGSVQDEQVCERIASVLHIQNEPAAPCETQTDNEPAEEKNADERETPTENETIEAIKPKRSLLDKAENIIRQKKQDAEHTEHEVETPCCAAAETESCTHDSVQSDVSFSFVHPLTKMEIKGTVLDFTPPILRFKPDNESLLNGLRFGQKTNAVLTEQTGTSNVSVQIQELRKDSAELCILT